MSVPACRRDNPLVVGNLALLECFFFSLICVRVGRSVGLSVGLFSIIIIITI